MSDKKERVVIITGGAGVIGFEIARGFAKLGDAVVILGLDGAGAKAAAEKLTAEFGTRALGLVGNVVSHESLEAAKAEILKEFGTIDVLVNCAGGNNPMATTDEEYYGDIPDGKSLFDLTVDGMNAVFSLNYMGTFIPTQVFGKVLAEKGSGNILNISSMNAYTPLTKIPAYSGAKAGINNFTQWLAVYFSRTGVRVNAIAPGFLVTAQNKALLFDENNEPTPRTGKILAGTPMLRFGKPEELVGAVTFLVDDAVASFITGVIIPVDGGYSAYSGV